MQSKKRLVMRVSRIQSAMAILSTMVGAVLLSRAVNDERLAKRFLKAAAEGVQMGSSADDAQHGSRQ